MRRHVLAGLLSAFGVLPAAADPSMECSLGASSQVEIGNCLAAVEDAVNTAMGVYLEDARVAAEELDQITERDVAVPALAASQAAWEAYRAAQCDYRGALFGGGSGTGIEIQSCRIDVTRDRIDALQGALR